MFLALAVGIVVGTAALNGPIQDNLNDNIGRLSSEKRVLEGDVELARRQLEASDDFAAAVAPRLVDGALADERVLLVTAPDTSRDLVDRLRPLLTEAGAAVTGELEVLPALAAPAQRQVLEDLVAQVVPAGVRLPAGSPVERAAAELAAALTVRPGKDPIDAGEAQAVVAAFEEADLLAYRPEAGGEDALSTATLVVLVAAPGPGQQPDAGKQQQHAALTALARAFDNRSRGVVVAGPTSSVEEGGLVKALRDTSTVARDVSSVDNLERGIGQVAVVLALVEQVEKKAGQYGAGPGASGPLPVAATS